MLFFDSPAGTGYSYYEEEDLIPTNISGIADDLYGALEDILAENPAFTVGDGHAHACVVWSSG